MARYSIEDTTLTNIADAIRSKTGKTDGIVVGEMANEINGIEAGGNDPFEAAEIPSFVYTVDAISGVRYGFALNSNGYYQSQNRGVNSSYAICRVHFTVAKTCNIVFDVINYGESGYDYAIFGNIDVALKLSSSSIEASYYQNFAYSHGADIQKVTYFEVPAGNHYIDVKFIKTNKFNAYGYDCVQFKIQEAQKALIFPQELTDRIVAVAVNEIPAFEHREGYDGVIKYDNNKGLYWDYEPISIVDETSSEES